MNFGFGARLVIRHSRSILGDAAGTRPSIHLAGLLFDGRRSGAGSSRLALHSRGSSQARCIMLHLSRIINLKALFSH